MDLEQKGFQKVPIPKLFGANSKKTPKFGDNPKFSKKK
jgi:hypothetical protein